MDRYWESIREKVCRKCIDGDGKGNCRLQRHDSCALQEFHPAAFSLVAALEADSYDAYVQTLRARICFACEHQTADGVCRKRQSLECALDRYYPLIIDVDERLLATTASNSQLQPFPTT